MASTFWMNGVKVEDTFSEMFSMWVSRVVITADTKKWAMTAARTATGFGSAIFMSPAEAGVERLIPSDETPDGRPGAVIQVWQRTRRELKKQLISRIGSCVLTCPTTSVFDGLPRAKRRLKVGRGIRYFGDGFQEEGEVARRRVWRIPVMEGEFIIEDAFGAQIGVAGGNFIIMARNRGAGLGAAEEAVSAIKQNVEGVILSFPGGICRSGSKIGSRKYKLTASTNHPFCPTLREAIPSETMIPEGVSTIYEIVINGLSLDAVNEAISQGIKRAVKVPGVERITAVNFGGRLGQYRSNLKSICLP